MQVAESRDPVPLRPVHVQTPQFRPRRRAWPGLLGASIIGAGIAAAAVSSYYDDRSVGTRLDEAVAVTQARVEAQKQGLADAATNAAATTSAAGERVAGSLADVGITAAVKTALAADPALSAVKIDVNTEAGVVRLDGPAPDERARERAAVLAAAPQGVVRVDNRLVVVGAAPPN